MDSEAAWQIRAPFVMLGIHYFDTVMIAEMTSDVRSEKLQHMVSNSLSIAFLIIPNHRSPLLVGYNAIVYNRFPNLRALLTNQPSKRGWPPACCTSQQEGGQQRCLHTLTHGLKQAVWQMAASWQRNFGRNVFVLRGHNLTTNHFIYIIISYMHMCKNSSGHRTDSSFS